MTKYMGRFTMPIVVGAVVLLAACSGDKNKADTSLAADTTLNRDLALAGKDTAAQPQLTDVPATSGGKATSTKTKTTATKTKTTTTKTASGNTKTKGTVPRARRARSRPAARSARMRIPKSARTPARSATSLTRTSPKRWSARTAR